MRVVLAGLTLFTLLLPLAAHAQQGQPAEHGSAYTGDGFDDITDPRKKGLTTREPIARTAYDALVTRMFNAVDANHDGTVTLAELQTLIAGRKEAAIAARFAAVDTDHDKAISYGEFAAWQRGLGSVVLDDASAGGGTLVVEQIRPVPGRRTQDLVMANMIEPLSATVLVAANTNYDAGMSLAELLAYEGKRFDALDANHDGFLVDDELRKRPPPR